ncbi:hypothetical protein BJ165DRAFT_853995 [Panaeolus papilionaceus]|nr:hypothetical protein BJ165DRAFT_853995 [Panaeolus papilionaceus]
MSRTISAPLFGDLEIMTFVIKALYNPYRPSCCSGSLAIALASLPMDPYTMHYRDDEDFHIRNVFHKILYKFVVRRRHDNDWDMVTWMKEFSTCADCSPSTHCQPISSFCHRTWMEKKGDLTRSHLFRIANLASEKTNPRQTASWSAFLQEAIVLLCGALLLAPFKAVAQGKYPLWPRKLSSLIPFGTDDAVYSILQWFRISPQAPLLQFLLAIVLHVRSPFYPSLIKFNFPTIVINSTKAMLDVFIKIFDEKTIPHVMRLVAVETFMQQSFALSEFLEYFQSRYLSGDVRLFLVDGCETKALQLCSLITCLRPVAASVKDTDNSNLYHELERLAKTTGSSLYRKLNMHLATNPFQQRMLHAVLIVEEDSNKFFGSLDEFEAEMGLSFIWFGGYEYGCAARSSNGCQESLETAGREMKLCDRCVGVYYCGRECQHSDWNDANHPHRKVSIPDGLTDFYAESVTQEVGQYWKLLKKFAT